PLLSYARAPVPWVSLTKMENLSFGSSMPTVLGCSCANSRPPSFVPMMPSALSGPCQTSFHLAPAAMTPGIAVTITSFAAVGCGKVFGCCAAAIAPKQKAIVNATLNFIGPPRRVAGVYIRLCATSRCLSPSATSIASQPEWACSLPINELVEGGGDERGLPPRLASVECGLDQLR